MYIKTFIIEEHHEAYIVWNYAIQQGLIPATGNTLFHVVEHSDVGTPQFNISLVMCALINPNSLNLRHSIL